MSEASLRRKARPPSRDGIPNTEAQKEKIRNTLKAMGHHPPPMYGDDNPSRRPEVRAKISAALKDVPLSEQHKAALRRNHRKVNPPSMQGANSHLWKGGRTSESGKIRNSPAYRAWRAAVFTRDNYTCQNCGATSATVRIEADHIKPFSLYPDLRLDVDNGRTLCETCHDEIGWRGSHVSKEAVKLAREGRKRAKDARRAKFSEETLEALRENGKQRAHERWHVNRGIVNPDCALCAAENLIP